MTIGELLNYVPVLETADCCAAMGDAEEAVKNMADYVSVSSVCGGVGDIIEHFCFGEGI